MNNRIIFLAALFISLIILGCVQEKAAKSELKFEEIKDCQCHTLAYKYPAHLNGTNYCLDCHRIEDHPEVNYSVEDLKDCSKCHESSLLRIHMPNHTCVDCHGDANSIHQQFESKFLEGGK